MGETSQTENTLTSYKELKTTFDHRGFTLIGSAFLVFAMGFLFFLTNDVSLKINLMMMGLPLVVVSLVVAHYFLGFIENYWGCMLLSFFCKGFPFVVYRKWIRLNSPNCEPGLSYGNRHLVFSAIESLELTIWGSLLIRSTKLCGAQKSLSPTNEIKKTRIGDVVFKIPFTVTSLTNQQLLINSIRKHKPNVYLNKRLQKALLVKNVPGVKLLSSLGVIFLLLVLLDNGYSDFRYLEILKHYYLAQTLAREPQENHHTQKALMHLNKGDAIDEHPLAISWVTAQFLNKGSAKAGLCQAKAEALWFMGKKQEAISLAKDAEAIVPKNYRLNLRLARMYEDQGQRLEANREIKKAIENHHNSLLPKLYMLAITANCSTNEAIKLYSDYEKELDENVFGQEPVWPPGGNRFLDEFWYKDDIQFVINRLLNAHGR